MLSNCNIIVIKLFYILGCRFELILKFLHLNDSETQPQRGDTAYDKLYKVRPFLHIVLENFKT